MPRYTLGLDLGSNSVGWAMIAHQGETFPEGKNMLLGVRVFPEGVGKAATGAEMPRGQDRRIARGQRRMHYRRRQRRMQLAKILRQADLLPADSVAFNEILKADPYLPREGVGCRLNAP